MKLDWNFFMNAIIGILVVILLLQRCGEEPSKPVIIRDTIYTEIHDTTPGKIVYLAGEVDTAWYSKPEYVPDPNYTKLLEQYVALGNTLFKKNTFSSTFPVRDYGTVTSIDTIKGNELVGTSLISDLKIPEVTVIKEAPPRRQVYIGGALIGNPQDLINGAQVGTLYKDRKDRIYGAHIGYNVKDQSIQYSLSSYWKINLKRK